MAKDRVFLPGQDSVRLNSDTVVVASGGATRNRDFWSGKSFRVLPGGMRLEAFSKNPMMLWHHIMNIPLGTMKLAHSSGVLLGTELDFHRKKIPVVMDGFASAIGEFDTAVIASLWDEGFLKASSVHLTFTSEDEANAFETDDEIVFPTSEVLEASIVTIPADADAVKQRFLAFGMSPTVVGALTGDKTMVVQSEKRYWNMNLIGKTLNRIESALGIKSTFANDDSQQTVTDDSEDKRMSQELELQVEIDETVDETEIELSLEDDDVEGAEFELNQGTVEEIELNLDEAQIVDLAQNLATSEVFVTAFLAAISEGEIFQTAVKNEVVQTLKSQKFNFKVKGKKVEPVEEVITPKTSISLRKTAGKTEVAQGLQVEDKKKRRRPSGMVRRGLH